MEPTPRVSIGMPVYNGERYLRAALDSLLAQTFSDLELIISDNASTDATAQICQEYAARDPRIRYVRQPENLGAARNFNETFALARGEYFKWAAHDDICAPTLVERCVEVLDRDPSAALCYARTAEVDEEGRWLRDLPSKPQLGDARASRRFYECVCVPHAQVAVFGVARRSVLAQTPLIGRYSSSDRVLLGDLALRGRLVELPDVLFFRRDHPAQSYRQYRNRQEYQAWFDPSRAGRRTYPHWRLLREHLRAIDRAPLAPGERLRCYACMVWWVRRHWRYLVGNLLGTEPTRRGQRVSGRGAGQPAIEGLREGEAK